MTLITSLRSLPIGQRIRWARTQKSISQERLAAEIGTSRRHMIRIEQGVHRPGPAFLARIAEATDQDPAFFTDEDDAEEDPAMMLERATGLLSEALLALARSAGRKA